MTKDSLGYHPWEHCVPPLTGSLKSLEQSLCMLSRLTTVRHVPVANLGGGISKRKESLFSAVVGQHRWDVHRGLGGHSQGGR